MVEGLGHAAAWDARRAGGPGGAAENGVKASRSSPHGRAGHAPGRRRPLKSGYTRDADGGAIGRREAVATIARQAEAVRTTIICRCPPAADAAGRQPPRPRAEAVSALQFRQRNIEVVGNALSAPRPGRRLHAGTSRATPGSAAASRHGRHRVRAGVEDQRQPRVMHLHGRFAAGSPCASAMARASRAESVITMSVRAGSSGTAEDAPPRPSRRVRPGRHAPVHRASRDPFGECSRCGRRSAFPVVRRRPADAPAASASGRPRAAAGCG